MSRRIIGLLITLVISAIFVPFSMAIAKPQSTGRVVYIKLLNDGRTCAAFEKDLITKKTTRLVLFKSPIAYPDPDSFSLAVSPDGCKVAIRCETTLLLWERTTGKIHRLRVEAPTELSWSPSGKHLLIRGAPLIGDTQSRVYSVKTGKIHTLRSSSSVVAWSANGKRIIAAITKGKLYSVALFPADGGNAKTLFRWPRPVKVITQAPNSSGYALSDNRGIYLLNSHGQYAGKLKITLPDDAGVSLGYNNNGSRLAVFTKYSYGEPHVNSTQTLWCVTPKALRASKLYKWDDSMLPESATGNRYWSYGELSGWVRDKQVLLNIQAFWGGESLSDNHSDQFSLEAYDSSGHKGKLFDSGRRCLGLTWWPGPKIRKD